MKQCRPVRAGSVTHRRSRQSKETFVNDLSAMLLVGLVVGLALGFFIGVNTKTLLLRRERRIKRDEYVREDDIDFGLGAPEIADKRQEPGYVPAEQEDLFGHVPEVPDGKEYLQKKGYEYIRSVGVSTISRLTGIQQSLLYKYLNGRHKPWPKNIERIVAVSKGYLTTDDF